MSMGSTQFPTVSHHPPCLPPSILSSTALPSLKHSFLASAPNSPLQPHPAVNVAVKFNAVTSQRPRTDRVQGVKYAADMPLQSKMAPIHTPIQTDRNYRQQLHNTETQGRSPSPPTDNASSSSCADAAAAVSDSRHQSAPAMRPCAWLELP